jgi:TPR repeat protein
LATHLTEDEKHKLLSELEEMPTMAKQLRESCDQLTGQGQKQDADVKTEKEATKIEFQELPIEIEHNELKTRAEAGDMEAQFQIGELFEQKNENETDSEKFVQLLRNAAKWFEKAAEQGFVLAQFKLAETYAWERVFPDKKKEVHHWYQKAAEQGYGPAQLALARSFQNGYWTGSRNEDQAKHWFAKAARQGLLDE